MRGWTRLWHRHPGVRSGNQLTFGERAADIMRNAFGSWTFVGSFLSLMVVWMILNSYLVWGKHGHVPFDKFPWVLLNLFLSMLAGLQAALLLIAAKRADSIASELAAHTYQNTENLKQLMAENTQLTQEVKQNTDLLDEIHRHITDLTPKSGLLRRKS